MSGDGRISNGGGPPRTRQLSEGYDETHQRVQKVYELLEKHKGAGPGPGNSSNNRSNSAAGSPSGHGQQQQRYNGSSRGHSRGSGNNSPSPRRNSSQSPSPSKEGPRKSGRPKSSSPQNPALQEADAEARELEKLRCPSERAEVGSEREERRRKRCSDYPGLGASVFASDTLMKFSIIRNELHNVINGQLKRVEAEVGALTKRLQNIEEDLEKSEAGLGSATTELASAVQELAESDEIQTALKKFSHLENDNQLDQLQLFLCPPELAKEEIG